MAQVERTAKIGLMTEEVRKLNILTKSTGKALSAVRGQNEWKMISLAVDAGACATVANPDDLPNYEVFETERSRAGVAFSAAS